VICCVSLALLLRIEWERRTQLGSEDVDFQESDFFDGKNAQEPANAR
jgi:cell division protein FtsW